MFDVDDPKPAPVDKWLEQIDTWYTIALGISTFSLTVVTVIASVHLYFVIRYVSNPTLQSDLYWFCFICPIVTLCSCLGMYVPRTGSFLYSIGIVYLLFCAFVMVTLMISLYGSRKAMLATFLDKGVLLNPRVLPLGCCLFCVRKFQPTACNLRVLEWAVFQSPIVRVIIEILNMAVFFELEKKTNVFFIITNVISIISMLISSYGSYILIPAGSKALTRYRFLLMFRLIDTLQFLYTVQLTAFDFLMWLEILKPYDPLPRTATSQFWASLLASIEMLVASCVATYLFRPSKTAFFDLYPGLECSSSGSVRRKLFKIPFVTRPSPVVDMRSDPPIRRNEGDNMAAFGSPVAADKEPLPVPSSSSPKVKEKTADNGNQPASRPAESVEKVQPTPTSEVKTPLQLHQSSQLKTDITQEVTDPPKS